MKNKKIVLPIIFGIMLLACLLKIIFLPTYFTFGCAGVLLIFFLNAVIQIDADIYVSKKEYNEAFEEWKTQRDLNPEIGKFKKKKRTPWTVYVGCALILWIFATPMLMFGANNCRNFIWSYKNDIKTLKKNNIERYGHFPSEIPNCAQNVEWEYRGLWGGNRAILKMNVDDEYIEELEKTFTDKEKLFEYKVAADPEYEDDDYTFLGWFSESQGIEEEYFEKDKKEFEGVYPVKAGDGVLYITYIGDGMYDSFWDVGVMINRNTNTVVYFSNRITR